MRSTFPGFGPAGSWPTAEDFQMAAINPLPFWLRFAEQWQKAWADAMTSWTKAGNPDASPERQLLRSTSSKLRNAFEPRS